MSVAGLKKQFYKASQVSERRPRLGAIPRAQAARRGGQARPWLRRGLRWHVSLAG